MLLIVDGDPIVYRSGFAAETISYDCVLETPEGEPLYKSFVAGDGKSADKAMKEWLEANQGYALLGKYKEVDAEPVSHALEIVRSSLESISKEAAEHFECKTHSRVLILSGKTNWRDKVATLLPYKGNRDPAHKPVHYTAIREYMCAEHAAYVTDGIEADDACAMLAWETRNAKPLVEPVYCVASIDKDLDQIPGWHYDYMKKVFYFVDVEDAAKSFWQQVLSGDPTDNIGGCWKIGAGKAAKLMDAWRDAAPTDIWSNIIDEYSESQSKKGCPYAEKSATEVALENARLLYLQQKPDELWEPPGKPRSSVSKLLALR